MCKYKPIKSKCGRSSLQVILKGRRNDPLVGSRIARGSYYLIVFCFKQHWLKRAKTSLERMAFFSMVSYSTEDQIIATN